LDSKFTHLFMGESTDGRLSVAFKTIQYNNLTYTL